jgi:predicted dehydrogenase
MSEKITRRKFIQTSAAATAVGIPLGVGMFAMPQKKVAPGDTILMGVIGTGNRGTWETEIMKDTPGIKVVACCDIYPPHLANGLKYAEKGAKGYEDYRKLLENKDLDAVLICTPQYLHYQMALDTLEAAKHIICQKTMTMNAAEALSLSKAVKHSRSVFQVAYQWQSSLLFHEVRNMIRNGDCGQITHIRCNYNRNTNWRTPVEDPQYERLLNWRMYREYSGGLMAELCSHQINVVNWFLGALPRKVTGLGGIDYWKDGRETYDNVTTIFEYPAGIKATFQAITTNAFENVSMIFMGTEGCITLRKEEGQEAHFYAEPKQVKKVLEEENESVEAITSATRRAWARSEPISITVENNTKDDYETTMAMFLDFVDCVRNGKMPQSNVNNGRDVSICVDMALRAMENSTIEGWKPEYSG